PRLPPPRRRPAAGGRAPGRQAGPHPPALGPPVAGALVPRGRRLTRPPGPSPLPLGRFTRPRPVVPTESRRARRPAEPGAQITNSDPQFRRRQKSGEIQKKAIAYCNRLRLRYFSKLTGGLPS